MRDAEYYALLSLAFNGGVTRYEMFWQISLTEAQNMIHASGILRGNTYIWPDPRLSESGRAMLAVRDQIQTWRTKGLADMIDL